MQGYRRLNGKRLTIKDMQVAAHRRGGRFLSATYRGTHYIHEWQCRRGHIFSIRPRHVLYQGTWCQKCPHRSKRPFEDAERLFRLLEKERGLLCEATEAEYRTSRTKMWWRCASSHRWQATLNNVLHYNSGCPHCPKKGETACRDSFEKVFGRPFPKARPPWLFNSRGNRMELDGYSEEIGVAFEYHGIQHYVPVRFYQVTKQAVRQRQEDDTRKRDLCAQNGVVLFEIPYYPAKNNVFAVEEVEGYVRDYVRGSRDHSHVKERTAPILRFTASVSSRLTLRVLAFGWGGGQTRMPPTSPSCLAGEQQRLFSMVGKEQAVAASRRGSAGSLRRARRRNALSAGRTLPSSQKQQLPLFV